MAYGLRIFDSGGNITLDTIDLLPRFVGSFTVNVSSSQRDYRFQLPINCTQANTIVFTPESYGQSYFSLYNMEGNGIGPSWSYVDNATHELVVKDVDYFTSRTLTVHVYYRA